MTGGRRSITLQILVCISFASCVFRFHKGKTITQDEGATEKAKHALLAIPSVVPVLNNSPFYYFTAAFSLVLFSYNGFA
ncbi:hypothetical protein V8C35DRAFT_296065 [Trichoderma chlorosporum]